MRKEVSEKDFGTAIILAVEQFFIRKFKAAAGDQRKYLNWQDLLSSPNINRLLITKKSAITQGQKQTFLTLVRQALANHPLYSVIDTLTKKKQKISLIKRSCVYQKIHSHEALVHYVYKHYLGTLVDDQLFNFSYRDVAKDIEKGINQSVFVKMALNNKGDSFYIFPNLEVHSFRIKDWQANDFQKQYLGICKEFGKQQQRIFESVKKFQIQIDVNEEDPNYKLPGFLQLKKQWKIRQQLQLILKMEQDRKAQKLERETVQKKE